ncbi:MAG: PGPGW domain-containing protein [Actinomycetes bacterium]
MPDADLPDDRPDEPGHGHPFRAAYSTAYEAAIEAETATGEAEQTEAEARRHLLGRLARTVAGFLLVGVGLAGLVLPGPGWLLIVLGLGLLPYAWAQRTIRAIRRRVPGIPEDGRIPATTWVVMGLVVAVVSALTILFGAEVATWLARLWGDPDRLVG